MDATEGERGTSSRFDRLTRNPLLLGHIALGSAAAFIVLWSAFGVPLPLKMSHWLVVSGAENLITMLFCLAWILLGSFVISRARSARRRAPKLHTTYAVLAGFALVVVMTLQVIAAFISRLALAVL